jgi:dTDP-4-dehydrorhamnose 3,5-epimerase
MHFEPTNVDGAFVVTLEPHRDERGFFSRVYCEDEYRARGLEPHIAQSSLSFNRVRGTLRGLHYQAPPAEEAKTVSCSRGAVFDVVVDLRRDSPTFLRWHGTTLSADNFAALYVPKGCAHGFITLADEALVRYDISVRFAPELARGLRYDDPAVGIEWPFPPAVVTPRDLAFPAFDPEPGAVRSG